MNEPPTEVRRLHRRLARVGGALAAYVAAVCAAWLVTHLEHPEHLHPFWIAYGVSALIWMFAARRRSPFLHRRVVNTAFGAAVFGAGYLILTIASGSSDETLGLWTYVVLAAGIPAGAYAYWLATRPALRAWVGAV